MTGGHVFDRIVDDTDPDTLHVVKTQDVEGVMKAMKEVTTFAPARRSSTQDSQKLVGSVPTLVAYMWAKECGVQLHSKEWLQKARARLKHDPDYRMFRAGH